MYLKRVSEQDYEGFFRKQNFTVMKSSLHRRSFLLKAQQPNMWPPYLQYSYHSNNEVIVIEVLGTGVPGT